MRSHCYNRKKEPTMQRLNFQRKPQFTTIDWTQTQQPKILTGNDLSKLEWKQQCTPSTSLRNVIRDFGEQIKSNNAWKHRHKEWPDELHRKAGDAAGRFNHISHDMLHFIKMLTNGNILAYTNPTAHQTKSYSDNYICTKNYKNQA